MTPPRPGQPRLVLYGESAPLSASATFRLGRAALPVLAAASAGTQGYAVIRALQLVALEALPSYPWPALVASALLGGLVVGLALTPAAAEGGARDVQGGGLLP